MGRRSRRHRHQHERRRLPVHAGRSGRHQLRVEQGRRARGRRGQQQPRGDVLPRQHGQRRERVRHPARGRVQPLVELRSEGRRERAGLVGTDHQLHRVHLRRSPHLGCAYLHQRDLVCHAERGGRGGAHSRAQPELDAAAGGRSADRHRRRPRHARLGHPLRSWSRQRVSGARRIGGAGRAGGRRRSGGQQRSVLGPPHPARIDDAAQPVPGGRRGRLRRRRSARRAPGRSRRRRGRYSRLPVEQELAEGRPDPRAVHHVRHPAQAR
jgi:hypothetical protein